MFSTDSRGIWTVVHPAGEIDLAVADKFNATVTEAGDWGRGHLAIDFSEVTFMDSSGISVIVAALKRTRVEAGQLVLVGLTDRVRYVLEVTGLTKILDSTRPSRHRRVPGRMDPQSTRPADRFLTKAAGAPAPGRSPPASGRDVAISRTVAEIAAVVGSNHTTVRARRRRLGRR